MERKIVRATYDSFKPDPKPVPVVKDKKRKNEFSELRKEADKVWSEYIRQYYADNKGKVKCATCSTVDHWKYLHCGHFISREQNIVRFDFRNCAPQCPECNVAKRGNLDIFELWIDHTHGFGTAEQLKNLAKQPFKLFREHLNQIISNYKIIKR